MGSDDSPSDEHITMLMGMGFCDIDDVRKALTLAKNDINDAVAILTGEDSRGGFGNDIELKEVSHGTDVGGVNNNNSSFDPLPFGPQLENKQPVESMEIVEEVCENIDMPLEDIPEEFPTANMYELEDRVFTENWSIPYKKNESLAKCLYGAIKLSSLKKAESDKDCARFMDRVLIESFKKLLTSNAVKKWTPDIHEGVFNMIQLFVDLVAERLEYPPIPMKLLETLCLVFDLETEFHFKNRARKWDRGHYEDFFGYLKCPAMSPDYSTNKEPFGWVVDLINRFVQKGGLDCIINIIEATDKLSSSTLAALLKPFGCCSTFLNPEVIGYRLGGMADKVVHFINDMEADDMKEKEVDKVYDLLRTLHCICEALWSDKTSTIIELHLNTILKMLKLPHFNSRMNALKELSKLIKEAEKNKSTEITQDVILNWSIENKALSIAFRSSLHHTQYCEKLQNIVEFAGTKISLEELSTIWNMQTGKHITIIDNIHAIISSASQNFSTDQMEHFISLLEKSWKEEDDKSRERLLLLIGKVGRELKDNKIVMRFLELLWGFAHIKDLQLYLVNQAVQSHIDILTESSVVENSVKTGYVTSCVQDIKNNVWVVPAIRHILCNLQSVVKQKNYRTTIQDIQHQHGLLKLLCGSLIHSHKIATNNISPGTLSGDTVIENRYKYAEIVITHLKLIEFLLQDGGLYLSWNRCKELWDCLMLDSNNCDGDYETCFEWFLTCISDLQAETQRDLFAQKILKTDVVRMKEIGFKCLKSFFETVNIAEHKVRRNGPTIIVDKCDLVGLPYLWQLILESPYNNIAEDATKFLINVSYTSLAVKLRKNDQLNIHKRFISECHKKLEYLLTQLRDNEDIGPKEGKITRTFKKPLPIKGSCLAKSKVLKSIERLLNLACHYIITVEDNYVLARSFPPHGSCFYGYPITIHVIPESNKTEFDLVSHSNECFEAVRQKIATKLDTKVKHFQVYKNDIMLMPAKDHKLLTQLEFEKKQNLNIKVVSSIVVGATGSSTNEDDGSPATKPSSLLEREKCLPSFMLASEYKVFDKLYQLAELEESQITAVLRKLLQQLPTDGDVLKAIDIFSFQNPLSCSPGTRAGYASSSSSVLENYFKCSAPKMSTFRVLYNLQVLSSKLMPVLDKDSPNITHSFRENWLNAGGLGLIMNILLPDTLPTNADYELRQSCYYIILQLARFLLCGETNESSSTPTKLPNVVRTYGQTTAGETATAMNCSFSSPNDVPSADVSMTSSTPIKVNSTSPHNSSQAAAVASSWPGARGACNDSPTNQLSSSPGSAASFTPDNANLRKRLYSTSSVLESVSPTVKMVIENISEEEFKETISSLMQVTWSAAAGQLQLNTRRVKVLEESHAHNLFSTQLQQQPNQELKAGLCLGQDEVSEMDSVLSNNSLELLVMCLQLRPKLINMFYQLPNVSEFIVDILTGSPCSHVRTAASLHLYTLSATEVKDSSLPEIPKEFLINILLKAQLPVWNVSGTIRGTSYKLLLQCQQYFELLSSLVCQLSLKEQSRYNINPAQLLEEELAFLSNSDSLNVEMVLGHLKLSNALFTCEGVQKETRGQGFTQYLLDEFLFSASKMESVNTSLSTFSVLDVNIHSVNSTCRKEAFDLLLTISDRCPLNIKVIAEQLIQRHHSSLNSKEWNFQPPISSRPSNGFVGLSNAGATCYMNSILQQLYMQPGIREAILKIDDSSSRDSDTVLSQIQNIFGHLLESQTQYFRPEGFWKTFKLWGEPVNLREQQDALEFYTNITDQLDEHLKTLKKVEVFKKAFSGMFVDQKICKECTHNFERDESFSSLPVTVKSGNLEASLEQFVHNEIMEGDNAYYCEKCCERRTTVKRTCIKQLPPILVIQLKRFWYDWERNRAIKFDDYFKFPFVLDMEPYTREGIIRKEADQLKASGNTGNGGIQESMKVVTDNQRYYELVGVVVHSGQASAGHYYAFVKNRQNTVGEYNKWYKFNDTSVEKFQMTEEALEIECFGGDYKVSQAEGNNQYPENRTRNWNGYMLFYETMDKNRLPSSSTLPLQDPRGQMFGDILRSYPVSPCSSTSSNPPSPGSKDSLSQLSALIRKGEKKGIFKDNMPTYIKRNVNEENKQFVCNRDIYNEEYFHFIRELCSTNTSHHSEQPVSEKERKTLEKEAVLSKMKLATHFLINTYFKTAKTFRSDIEIWSTTVENIMASNIITCNWFLEFLASDQGKVYLVPYLLECPDKSNRDTFSWLLYQACSNVWKKDNKVTKPLEDIIELLLSFLNAEVGQHIKNASQYFTFFYKYACICLLSLSHLSERGCFGKMQQFLLGPKPTEPEKLVRRWTTVQTLELTALHNTMALIAMNTAVDELYTAVTDESYPTPRNLFQYPDQLELSDDIRACFYGAECYRHIHECLFACMELPNVSVTVCDVIMYGCWCNLPFSVTFFQQMQMFLAKAQVNDFKHLFSALRDVLSLVDAHQQKRIEIFVNGSKDDSIEGIFNLIHASHGEDCRRAYQCIKFLVTSSAKLPVLKDYLLEHCPKWQWAVEWLRKTMSEISFWPAKPEVTNDNHTSFQRTVSAQNTLAEATKLLSEIETHKAKNKVSQPTSSVNVIAEEEIT